MRDPFDIAPEGHEPRAPMRAAEAPRDMPKRFYDSVDHAVREDGLFVLRLDARPVKTPARAPLAVASRRLADALVAEWMAQRSVIDPLTMPLTRLVNAAIDGVAADPAPVRAEILRYAGTDLLCYRAEYPARLVALQDAAWNPLIDWMHERFGARFVLAAGIMPVTQFPETIAAVDAALGQPSPLQLAALSTVTTLTGSAMLALAVLHARLTARQAWDAAHVDENFEIELWGEDAEAAARMAARWDEMQAAALAIAGV